MVMTAGSWIVVADGAGARVFAARSIEACDPHEPRTEDAEAVRAPLRESRILGWRG